MRKFFVFVLGYGILIFAIHLLTLYAPAVLMSIGAVTIGWYWYYPVSRFAGE